MNIHCFQHSPSEGLGEIEPWARKKGHRVASTQWHVGETAPKLAEVDWLMVMGGPMNIYEHRTHPWLEPEKRFLAEAIRANKTILGICLGAQLIADALGGKVFQNAEVEIGWSPVRFLPEAARCKLFAGFPSELTPLHWHGDTFSLPPGATNVAESDGCTRQAFFSGDRIVGLQFHLEVGACEVARFLEAEPGESESLGTGRRIQTRTEIRKRAPEHLPAAHAALYSLLEAMELSVER